MKNSNRLEIIEIEIPLKFGTNKNKELSDQVKSRLLQGQRELGNALRESADEQARIQEIQQRQIQKEIDRRLRFDRD